MRHLILLLIISVLSTGSIYAQKGKVYYAKTSLDESNLSVAKENIDAALEHEKSIDWAYTYIIAGRVYRKLFAEGKDKEGLKKAMEFYKKAIELDAKGDKKGKGKDKYKNDLKIDFTTLKTELLQTGVEGFNKEDYEKAIFSFTSVLDINKSKVLTEEEIIDTAIIYNIALAAYNAEKFDIAKDYFKQSVDLDYGGSDAVLLLNQIYENEKDSASIGETLKIGFEKYPEDSRILTKLINLYLSAKKNDEALEYLNKAIEKDPSNATYYYARGVLYDQSKDIDKAEIDYLKCIELDAEYYNALYNVGVIYFNQGVEAHNIANEISDLKKYNVAKNEANKLFEKALPYMEKALQIIESDPDALNEDKANLYDSLRNLYYRFDKMDKYNEMKKRLEELGV